MDFYQRVAWETHYFVGADFETLLTNNRLYDHLCYRLRPLGRVLEQAVLMGALFNALFPLQARDELVEYVTRFRRLCVRYPVFPRGP